MVSVHNSQALATGGLNATGATPLMYHGFLKCWRGLFSSQRAKLSERVEHLNGGLSKLREATAEVDKLSKTANEQRAMLTVKQEEADRAMENIQKAMEAAVSNRSEVETLQKKLATEEVKMADRKKQVEKELAEVQPVLEAARAAVGGIKSDNLNEIKSLKMPPEPIRDVLEGVLRIMGNFDTSWISMKRFLGNRSVKDEIINFDSRNITPEIHDSVSGAPRAEGELVRAQHDLPRLGRRRALGGVGEGEPRVRGRPQEGGADDQERSHPTFPPHRGR